MGEFGPESQTQVRPRTGTDGWPVAYVAEATAGDERGGERRAGGGPRSGDARMRDEQFPDFLRQLDTEVLELARGRGSPTALADHVEYLRNTVSTLLTWRPVVGQTLQDYRLPYLEKELQNMRDPDPIPGQDFYAQQDADVFIPRVAKQQAMGGRKSCGHAQFSKAVNVGVGKKLACDALKGIGFKASGNIRNGSGSRLFGIDNRPFRNPQPPAVKPEFTQSTRLPLTQRTKFVTYGQEVSWNPRKRQDVTDRHPQGTSHKDRQCDPQNAARKAIGMSAEGMQDRTSQGPVELAQRSGRERHASTYDFNSFRSKTPLAQKRSPSEFAGDAFVDPSCRKRPRSGTKMTRWGKPEKAASEKNGLVIDLMESEDEAGESAGVMADDPQSEQGYDVQAGTRPRTRSSAGAKRALSPSGIDMEKELEGLRYQYPEEQMVGAVEVTPHDLLTLKPFEFVNDTIMDYYSKKIADDYRARYHSRETNVKLHWFNSFFYKKLTEKCKGSLGDNVTLEMYNKVCKWTKNVDVFAQDYLLIPIHDTAHWSLAIICHPGGLRCTIEQEHRRAEIAARRASSGKAGTSHDYDEPPGLPMAFILHLDPISMGGHETKDVGNALRQWLRMEWENDVHTNKQVRGEDGGLSDCVAVVDNVHYMRTTQLSRKMLEIGNLIKVHRMKRIQYQDNYYDCGLYTLTYMEFFAFQTPNEIRPAPKSSRAELQLEWQDVGLSNDDFLTKRWFDQPNGSSLRFSLMYHLLRHMVNKAVTDGPAETLQTQICNAQKYIDHYQSEAVRYHTPIEVFQNPEIAQSPQVRRSSSRVQKRLQWPEDPTYDPELQLQPARNTRMSTRAATEKHVESDDELLESLGLGPTKPEEAADEGDACVVVGDDCPHHRERRSPSDDFGDESPKHCDLQQASRHAPVLREPPPHQAHHPPIRPPEHARVDPGTDTTVDDIVSDSDVISPGSGYQGNKHHHGQERGHGGHKRSHARAELRDRGRGASEDGPPQKGGLRFEPVVRHHREAEHLPVVPPVRTRRHAENSMEAKQLPLQKPQARGCAHR